MSPRSGQVAFYSFRLQHCISEHNFLGSSPSRWKTPALGAVLRSADCWHASFHSSCPHLRVQSVYHTSFPHSSCRAAFSPLSHSLSLWLWSSAVTCSGRLELSGTGCALQGAPLSSPHGATLQSLLPKPWHQHQIQSVLSIIFTGDWSMTESWVWAGVLEGKWSAPTMTSSEACDMCMLIRKRYKQPILTLLPIYFHGWP